MCAASPTVTPSAAQGDVAGVEPGSSPARKPAARDAGMQELLEGGQGAPGGSGRNAAWADTFGRFDEQVPEWPRVLAR